MAKQSDSEDKTPDAGNSEEAVARRKRMRTLVLGTLAASGAFQLNGWQAQAHGNRSSHSVTALRSDLFLPQDYVTFRQQLTAPDAKDTVVLSRFASKLEDMRVQMLSGEKDARMEADFNALQKTADNLEGKLQLRETSRQALDLINKGDIDAAVAIIEGEGEPDRVTYEYLWTITDIAYLGRKDTQLTDANLPQLTALSARAMNYLAKLREMMPKSDHTHYETAILTRAAEIYHNIASYLIPDIGEPTAKGLQLGYEAAVKARELRSDLGQPIETVIADWVLGNYEARRGHIEEAVSIHKRAMAQAERLGNPVQVAWNKFALARLQGDKALLKKADGELVKEINMLLDQGDPNDPAAALLRLEIQNHPGR